MSEKQDPRTRLLAEAFHEDWNGVAAGFARQAAGHARRRRRFRHGMLAVGATAGALLLLASLPKAASRRDPTPKLLSRPAYEIISDDELLVELHDRPVLLVRNDDGSRQIVLLEP